MSGGRSQQRESYLNTNQKERGKKEKEGECEEKGIHGKETTPFLLARVTPLTGGDSLASNIRLVYNNAKLAAQTAVAYCEI